MIQFHLSIQCDQFGTGVIGWVDSPLCLVTAILRLVATALVHFFVDPSHKLLTKQKFVTQIRSILNSLGVQQDQYAGHSSEIIGAATTAAAAGVEDSTIQILGRWHSAAFLQYIRTPTSGCQQFLANSP